MWTEGQGAMPLWDGQEAEVGVQEREFEQVLSEREALSESQQD